MDNRFAISEDDFEDAPDEGLDPRDLDMQAQLAEVVHSFEGDVVNVKCKIYMVGKGRRRWLFDAMPVELGDIQNKLKNEYGPGIFENHVYINGSLKTRLKLDIGETLADKYPGRAPQPTNEGLKSSDVLTLVREMNANQAEQQRLMFERLENTIRGLVPQQTSQPAVDPVEMQRNMLTQMVQMKELLGLNQPVKQDDPIGMFQKFLALTNDMQALSGEHGSGAMIAGLAKEFLPKLAELAKISASAPKPATAANPRGSPTPDQISHMAMSHAEALQANTGPNPPQTTGDKTTMLNDFIVNKALNFLIPAAARGFSPVTYAELLLDQADIYSIQQEVINYVLGEESIEQMILINPEVANYRPWFDEMKATIQSLVTEVSDESMTTMDAMKADALKAHNMPDLTNGQNEPINLKDAPHSAHPIPTVASPERVTGDLDNTGDHVESG